MRHFGLGNTVGKNREKKRIKRQDLGGNKVRREGVEGRKKSSGEDKGGGIDKDG